LFSDGESYLIGEQCAGLNIREAAPSGSTSGHYNTTTARESAGVIPPGPLFMPH
jgi:hypothetical protein